MCRRYSLAAAAAAAVSLSITVGGGVGGDNAAEKSVDRQQLSEHVPCSTSLIMR